jgi:hypothetical protein
LNIYKNNIELAGLYARDLKTNDPDLSKYMDFIKKNSPIDQIRSGGDGKKFAEDVFVNIKSLYSLMMGAALYAKTPQNPLFTKITEEEFNKKAGEIIRKSPQEGNIHKSINSLTGNLTGTKQRNYSM